MSDRPNLFDFATSELSQDAFLKWLISWADKKYAEVDKALNACAVSFVQQLLGKKEDFTLTTIDVEPKISFVDVSAIINDKIFLLIEDKKGSKQHSNQLERYKIKAKEKYDEVRLVYFKMEPQGNYNLVNKAEYHHFTRCKMLPILETYVKATENKNQNNILIDFYENLQRLDEDINSYSARPFKDWDWHSWQGFYAALQKELEDTDWDYVSNPSGGFLGFWWKFEKSTLNGIDFHYYLQLQQETTDKEGVLIFRLTTDSDEARREIRDYYWDSLHEASKNLNIDISKTKPWRLGKSMAIAKLNTEYRKLNIKGFLDLQETVKNLRSLEKLIEATKNHMKEL